jgi:hypothetical protein
MRKSTDIRLLPLASSSVFSSMRCVGRKEQTQDDRKKVNAKTLWELHLCSANLAAPMRRRSLRRYTGHGGGGGGLSTPADRPCRPRMAGDHGFQRRGTWPWILPDQCRDLRSSSTTFAKATRREEQQEYPRCGLPERKIERRCQWSSGWPLDATKGSPICSLLKHKTAPKGDNRWVANEGGGS